MEFYDASQPVRPARDPLAGVGGDATQRLLERLEEVDDVCDPILDEMAAEPVDADIVASLEEVTGAPDAPAHFRRVHDRVERGQLTWDRFWQRPTDEYRGFEIIQAAIHASVETGALPAGPAK